MVLTATPDAGYVFSAWTGACTGTSSTCSVPITAASATVNATFVQVWTLSVSVTGSGVVTAAPAGITCGNGNNDCTENYTTGTNVTLTPTDVYPTLHDLKGASADRFTDCLRTKAMAIQVPDSGEPDRTDYIVQYPIRLK